MLPSGPTAKSVSHAVDERAHAASAGEDTAAQIVDVHHLHDAYILERLIEEEFEQIAIIVRLKRPLLRVLGAKGGQGRVKLEDKTVFLEKVRKSPLCILWICW